MRSHSGSGPQRPPPPPDSVAGNQHRNTAGMLLLAFSLAAVVCASMARTRHLQRESIEWIHYPTALGDPQLYTSFGQDDRYEPNLVFPAASEGLYRRSLEPIAMDDAKMFRVDEEAQGRCTVYQPGDADPDVYYLKQAPGHYHAFGTRLHWPEYTPPPS